MRADVSEAPTVTSEARTVARACRVARDADTERLDVMLGTIVRCLSAATALAWEADLTALALALEADKLAAQQVRRRVIERKEAAA